VADIIIPDVPDDVIAAIDIKAQRLGLSRNDFLLRALARERDTRPVTPAPAAKRSRTPLRITAKGTVSDLVAEQRQ